MRGLNIHTHTHKWNRLLGFFFFSLYILDILNLKKIFFLFLYSSAGGWGMCIPTFVDFFLFHLFFSFSLFLSFSFSFFSFLVARRVLMAFFFSSSARFSTPSSLDSFLLFFISFFFILVNGAIVKTLPPHPPHYLSLLTIPLLSRPVIN